MRAIALFLCLVVASNAATILVANYGDGSPSTANFNSAYAASSEGDTIQFPLSGSATWSATASTINRAITIDGNGTTLTGAIVNGFFSIGNLNTTALMRITGFIFNGVSVAAGTMIINVPGVTLLPNLRIDHNTLSHSEIAISFKHTVGLVDNNTFLNNKSSIYLSAGSRAQADAAWALPILAGTSNALFLEDNTFTWNSSFLVAGEPNAVVDTYNGARMVYRYNTLTAVTPLPAGWTGNFDPFVLHGNAAIGEPYGYWEAASGANRGPPITEMYNNTFNGWRLDFLCKPRGGSYLIYNNTLDTTQFNPRLVPYEEEHYLVQFDPLRTAWPAEDQLFNTFIWSNTLRLNGTPNTPYVEIGAGDVEFMQENRDYFLHAPEATGGSESFTGLGGASGTHPTDGSPYASSGTMVFSASGANAYYPYSAYIYPHPLQGGANVTPAASRLRSSGVGVGP